MNNSVSSSPAPTVHWLRSILGKLGFTPADGGYRRGEFRLEPAAAGWTLSAPWPGDRDPLGEPVCPGLWRFQQHHDGNRRVFALPGAILAGFAGEDLAGGPAAGRDVAVPAIESAIAWALGTAQGALPAGWAPPDAGTIDEWADPAILNIQQGSVLRRIEVVLRADVFALEVALVDALPPDLPGVRRRWLRRILLDTQGRWSLVRTAITRSGSVRASVDLSGVPDELARSLFLNGAESLRWVAARMVETVEFLISGEAGNQSLTLCQSL